MRIKRREFLAKTLSGMGGMFLASGCKTPPKNLLNTHDPTEIVTLGQTGIKLSRVGLGTGMRGGNRQSNQTRLGKEKLYALLRGAYDRGICWFDLADLYGTHPYLLPALKGVPRDKIVIVSKIWFRPGGIPEEERPDANIAIQRFCQEIGTDYIDLVLLHCTTLETWPDKLEEQMNIMAQMKKKGIIRAHGVSCHSLEALQAAAHEPWVDSVHARINPYATKMDGPPAQVSLVLQKLRQQGKGVVGMKIIGEGQFSAHSEKIDLSIDYALNLGWVDTLLVGFEKIEEIEDFALRVRKTPRRTAPPPLPNLDQAWYEDTSHLSHLIA